MSTASWARPPSGSPLAITSMRRMSCLWMWSRSKTRNKWVGYRMSMFYGVVVNIGAGVGPWPFWLKCLLKCLLALQRLLRSHLRNHMERSPASLQNPWGKMRATEKPRTQYQQELDSPFTLLLHKTGGNKDGYTPLQNDDQELVPTCHNPGMSPDSSVSNSWNPSPPTSEVYKLRVST